MYFSMMTVLVAKHLVLLARAVVKSLNISDKGQSSFDVCLLYERKSCQGYYSFLYCNFFAGHAFK